LALVVALLFSSVIGMKWRGLPAAESWVSLAGKSVFILGVSALLVGVVTSSTMMTAQSTVMSPGQSMSVSGTEVSLSSLSLKASPTTIYLPFYGTLPESLDTVLKVSLGGTSEGEISVLLRYYPSQDRFYSQPSIEGRWVDDVYVTAGPTDDVVNATSAMLTGMATASPSTVTITVEIIPGMSLVWAGVLLVLLGGAASIRQVELPLEAADN
jgi:cytochrome c biogenesis factor